MMCETEFLQRIEHLDVNQRKAVFHDGNCVVSAGAGSGKTTVLAYRFIRLVLEQKAHVDEILTLTFTRKAAAEMHERIHRQLLSYASDPSIALELGRFPHASISTLDSFCKRIVVSDAVHYGIAPDFTLDDEANRTLAQECALAMVENLKDHPGLDFLARLYNPADLIDNFLVGLAGQCFHPATPFDSTAAALAVQAYMNQYREALVEELVSASHRILEIGGSGKILEEASQACARVLDLDLLDDDEVAMASNLAVLDSLAVKKGRGKAPEVEFYNELQPIWLDVCQRLKSVLAALSDRRFLVDIYDFLARFRQSYLQRKRQAGVLTFADVAAMAVDILKRNKGIRAYYKQKFHYVMIDEFQDNNQLQKDLLFLLSERDDLLGEGIPSVDRLSTGKLFFVGDEKQSIYRFRGADVSVFKQLDRELHDAGGEHIELATNYRSEPALIELFNTVFPFVMENGGEDYEADFSPLSSRQPSEGITPSVSLWIKPLVDEQSEEEPADDDDQETQGDDEPLASVEAEAYAIANLIERMVSTDTYLIPCEDRARAPRRPTYRDIAILYRAASNQLHYEKALRVKDIPYTLSAVQSLFLEAPTNDLYHMLQLALYPSDRKAYIAALRSPFCRLSDCAILQLLDAGGTALKPFNLQHVDIPQSPEERLKFSAAADLFARLLAMVGKEPLARLVAFLWFDGGYRYLLLSDPSTLVYLEHGEYLLELARRYDSQGKGLAAFLDFIRPRLGQNEKLPDLDLLREETNGVQMMTIHKSKGLEFPIVILANMGSASRPGTTPLWYSFETPAGQIPIPYHMRPYGKVRNLFYEYNKPVLNAMETAEMKRLLYVALTRAKTHLVLTGCETKNNRGEQAPKRNLLALFRTSARVETEPEALGGIFSLHQIPDAMASRMQSVVSQKKVSQTLCTLMPYYQQAFPVAWQARRTWYGVTSLYGGEHNEPDLGEDFRSNYPQLLSVNADSLVLAAGLSADFGTWCHACIQQAVEVYKTSGLAQILDPRVVMPETFLNPAISEKDRMVIMSAVVQLGTGFLNSSLFVSLCTAKPLVMETEVEFALRREVEGDDCAVYGAIDLLVEYADELCIVDFKTDFNFHPEIHRGQLQVYREAVSRIWGKPVRSTLCYLRAPEIIQWET